MAFDTTGLDAACLDIGDDVTWNDGVTDRPIVMIIDTSNGVDADDGYGVVTQRTTGETTADVIAGMKRNDTITHAGCTYKVRGFSSDQTGWVIVELDKT